MSRLVRVLMFVIIGGALQLHCSSDDPPPSAPQLQPGLFDTLPDLSVTPMPDGEAEAVAVSLSRTLVAPVDLYERIHDDLALMRRTFRDSVPYVDFYFKPYLAPGRFLARFDSAVLLDTVGPTYPLFDSLNSMLRLDTIVASHFSDWHSFRFHGRLNPVRLIELYSRVDGFLNIEIDSYWTIEEGDEVYLYPAGEEFKYFFVHGWGDCPSGCFFKRIYYISSRDSSAVYVGNYLLYPSDSNTVEPAWLDTFFMARDTIYYGITWTPDSAHYWNGMGTRWMPGLDLPASALPLRLNDSAATGSGAPSGSY